MLDVPSGETVGLGEFGNGMQSGFGNSFAERRDERRRWAGQRGCRIFQHESPSAVSAYDNDHHQQQHHHHPAAHATNAQHANDHPHWCVKIFENFYLLFSKNCAILYILYIIYFIYMYIKLKLRHFICFLVNIVQFYIYFIYMYIQQKLRYFILFYI